MKKTLLKFGLLPCLLFVLAVSSCKKDDPTLAEQMADDWDVESFTEDGIESIGADITTMKMEYEAYSGDDGDFTWDITYVDGSNEKVQGEWSVDEADKELNLTFTSGGASGGTVTFDIDLDGNNLELEGVLDGFNYRIKADRD
jgi:hypothetical protein